MVAVGVLMPSATLSSPPALLRQRDSLRICSSDGLHRPVFLSSYRRHAFSCHASVASGGQPLKAAASTLLRRVLDPALLPEKAIQIVKERINIRSLSTVLALTYIFSSVIQQAGKYFMESNEPNDAAHMGFEFAGKAVYFAVWMLLYMELQGFSIQSWLTAGGLGISLLTLASEETFKRFLSSTMIHTTRPFVVNERIRAKIDSYEVSGTVEDVGRWSTTIRGEHGEAISIPNDKLYTNIVRNYSRKAYCPIKTHLAIDHSDAHKIKNIIADMRKVLENDPRVENGEVFLGNVNPTSQALMISVSCILKTSHLKEYEPVKEAILLDLLGVITDHGGRLAPYIHLVQKIDTDSE